MEIIGWITLALVAGALARALFDGARPDGLLSTVALGVAGLAIAAVLSDAIGLGRVAAPGDVATWVAAVTGSCLAVALQAMIPARVRLARADRPGRPDY